jgi:hypothetical protein
VRGESKCKLMVDISFDYQFRDVINPIGHMLSTEAEELLSYRPKYKFNKEW